MKYVKILFFAAIVSLVFSCKKENYPAYEKGPQDAETKVEVYFDVNAANEELEPTAEIYEVTLSRTDATAALTVPVNAFDPNGVFDVPASVEFAAGEAQATLVIGITKMELETSYELTVSVPADYYYWYKASENSGKNSFHLTALKQKWNDAGTCTFYDMTFGETTVSANNITIQNHEGTDDYRIVDPYATLYPEDFGPANVVFSISKKQVTFKTGLSDFWPGSGYYFYWDTTNYAAYCNTKCSAGASEGSVLVLVNYLLAVGSTPSYIVSFAFDWTGGPIVLNDGQAQ